MLWRLKGCNYFKEFKVPHPWEVFIRLLNRVFGNLCGKKSLAWEKSKPKTQSAILKISNKFRTPIPHLTIQACGSRAFWEKCFPHHALSSLLDRKRRCFKGGLNRGRFLQNGILPWSLLTWLLNRVYFYTDGVAQLSTFSSGKDVCKSTRHGCEHICVNRGNSYICKCSEGFVLAEDGKQCKSKWSELIFLL